MGWTDLPGGLLGLLGLLALLGLWMLGAHNRVTALRGAVLAAWAPMEAALQQRGQALQQLLAAAAEPLADERAALEAVQAAQAQLAERADAVRRRPAEAEPVAELARAEAALLAALPRLLALAEQQPALAEQPGVAAALAVLAQSRPQLAFARQTYNTAATQYNAAVAQFPTRLLAPVFRFGRAGML